MLQTINPTGTKSVPSRLALLDQIDWLTLGECWALCFSGMDSQGSGQYSFLASDPKIKISGNALSELEDQPKGRWFGMLGYEAVQALESLPHTTANPLPTPPSQWFLPGKLSWWDHHRGEHYVEHDIDPKPYFSFVAPAIASIESNMTRDDYIRIVRDTIEQIHAGEFYQANITRKFFGEFAQQPDPVGIFKTLCRVSPSAFSSLMHFGDTYLLSSSPEGFLHADASGKITTRPIKGTAAADDDRLAFSNKDKAENLMIVDLMRNDLSRHCQPGTVNVSELFAVHRFATVQQMISTVTAQRIADQGIIPLIEGCFPPGSMTGAPKLAAMQWCARQEKTDRGVYSGALGWIDTSTQEADLSVVIRTLIINKKRFEFQVGGGIVADSDPETEWQETLLKARGIMNALGAPIDQLISI